MIFSPGTCVQWRQDIGIVRRVLAAGTVHEVEFTSGQLIPCMGDVLRAAPDNVIPFTQKQIIRIFDGGN